MPKWNWLYEDFIKAFDDCSDEEQWQEAFLTHYINPQKNLLFDIHFVPKGFPSIQEVNNRIISVGKSRYNELFKTILHTSDYEFHIQLITSKILDKLQNNADEQEVFVIVGLDCTNIYSVSHEGKSITVLCLEAINGKLDGIQLLLSHECHHWARQRYFKEDIFTASIGMRLVTEGLAICFSEQLQPGYQASHYCYVPEDTVSWTLNNIEIIEKLINEHYEEDTFMDSLFSRTPHSIPIQDMPPRIGYVLGYIKVNEYLKKENIGAESVIGIPWQDVVESKMIY